MSTLLWRVSSCQALPCSSKIIVKSSGVFRLLFRFGAHLMRPRSQTEWSLTYGLIRSAIAHHEASKIAFDLIKSLVASEDRVTADNFGGLVTILDEFATTAGLAVESRKQQQQQRRGAAQASAPGSTMCVTRRSSVLLLKFNRRVSPLFPENLS